MTFTGKLGTTCTATYIDAVEELHVARGPRAHYQTSSCIEGTR